MIELSDYQKHELNRACEFASAPSTHLRPKLFPDGNMWCALYGDNLQEGLAGFGTTPEAAMADFDHNFRCQKLMPGCDCGGEPHGEHCSSGLGQNNQDQQPLSTRTPIGRGESGLEKQDTTEHENGHSDS